MTPDKKALAREACGCCVCNGTHDNVDCHACFCGMTARPPYNCHAERIERALTEWERVIDTRVCPFCREEDFDLVGLKAHLTRGRCDALDEVPSPEEDVAARKPAEGEARPKSPQLRPHTCDGLNFRDCCDACRYGEKIR